MPDAIIWFRRDLRISDNATLAQAIEYVGSDGILYPVFVFDPSLIANAGEVRMRALQECLTNLDNSLSNKLALLEGDPTRIVSSLSAAYSAPVFISQEFTPYAIKRDQKIVDSVTELRAIDSPYLVNPGKVFNQSGRPFQVFTPYFKCWQNEQHSAPIDSKRLLTKVRLGKFETQDFKSWELPSVSLPLYENGYLAEETAIKRFDRFLEAGISDYSDNRNRPDLDGTSRLSAALRWGVIHPRTLVSRLNLLGNKNSGAHTYLSELCWREFYADVLFHNPTSAWSDLKPINLEYESDSSSQELFQAWCEGMTGYPIVDAGMRQLLSEGWMHNRVRMITASFLAKDLHIHWTRGARWFLDHLIDGDIASNQHGWQWVTGTGTDASPYFRVFNPTTQGEKFDPSGEYIKKYVPELRNLSADQCHEPWRNPPLGPDYPQPIVDHAFERQVTLDRYQRAKSEAPGT